MPEQRPAARPTAAEAQADGASQSIWRPVINGILVFVVVNGLMKQFAPQLAGQTESAAPSFKAAVDQDTGNAPPTTFSYYPELAYPVWPSTVPLDISIYLSESLVLPPLSHPAIAKNKVFDEKNFQYATGSDKRLVTVNVPFSRNVRTNNGTLWAHIFIAQPGAVVDPTDPRFDPARAYRQVKPLTRYMPKKKIVKTKKLIGGGSEEPTAADVEQETAHLDAHGNPLITAYWHSNLTLEAVANSGTINYKATPPPLRQHIRLESTGKRDASGKNGWYYPIVFANDFWLLKEHMVELNETVTSLPLHIHLNPTVWWKFQVYASLDEAFKAQANKPGMGGSPGGGEFEEMKRVLVDTNMYLLATTMVVSLLHTVFEMLAFKNDISHWKNKKDNVGVSFRTILANVFMQLVIFLYLIDNSDGTSWMILFGQGMGIVLEAWKITKTVDVKIRPAPAGAIIPYRVSFEDKHKLSDLEKETKEYDEIAFKYLYMAAVPLLLAYAGYSLVYESHKSWYSFIITTLVGSVYAYGFLMMVPSLYINYRLKSVAHMPRKAMTYKFLNTFIDDLFAFTIKMPTLHRLATLRDDVIFFVYLWQAYHYKVDKKRINEFGQVAEPEERVEEEVANKDREKKEAAPLEVEQIGSTKGTNSGAKVEGVEGVVKRK